MACIDDSPKANNYKLLKTSSQMEDYFELLENKKPLISTDLEPQIISYQLSRVCGIILIEIIEYALLLESSLKNHVTSKREYHKYKMAGLSR